MTRNNSFTPKKSLGQNFLINPNVAKRIVDACQLKPSDSVLEIGPGKGALTDELSRQCQNILAIEKDKILAKQLSDDFENTNVTIIHEDILKYPFDTLPNNIKIIGNLPYNIVTPIIKKIISSKENVGEIFITVQLEYGQRLVAKPNTKSYGAFSCFVQYHTDAKILFKIRNSSFQPIPKVQSCFCHLKLLKKPKYQVTNKDFLFRIIHSCFEQRRKTIQNSLAGAIHKKNIPDLLKTLKINPKLRAENLGLEEYVQISNAATKINEEERKGGN